MADVIFWEDVVISWTVNAYGLSSSGSDLFNDVFYIIWFLSGGDGRSVIRLSVRGSCRWRRLLTGSSWLCVHNLG